MTNLPSGELQMTSMMQKARSFIYRNARPLDLARWQHHFAGADQAAVLTALAAYQNEDGGFGHALEPDAWNPASSPIQTWAATEILHKLGFADKTHPLIQGILRYLASGRDFSGSFWANTVKSNNDYPHAGWWHTASDSSCHNDYNPTAALAGFILLFADPASQLARLACRIREEALERLFSSQQLNDMHTVLCYVRLMEYSEQSTIRTYRQEAFSKRMQELVKASITQEKSQWESSYVCKPSMFFGSKDSIFFAQNKQLAEYECELITKAQLADGSWPVPWSWQEYPEQWAISKNWWKSSIIISNLLYLKGMVKF